jgi:uncharacterized membrane protein (DUF4010 family)
VQFVVGLADVDSVTVSMARLVPNILTVEHAAYAILGAVASDTVSKIAIGTIIGRGSFATKIAVMAAICFVIAGLALGLTLTLLSTR